MKTYKKVLIAIGAIIADFLISYFGLRLLIYIGYAQERFVDAGSVALLMFMTPLALSAVALVVLAIIKVISNIYIHIRYGLKYTDKEE